MTMLWVSNSSMTIERCAHIAYSEEWTLFGVQWGRECFGGEQAVVWVALLGCCLLAVAVKLVAAARQTAGPALIWHAPPPPKTLWWWLDLEQTETASAPSTVTESCATRQ